MDEIEQLREVGMDTPSPSPEEVATERRRLLASIEGTSGSARHWWQRGRVVLGVAVAAIAIPGGLALAGTFESEVNVPGSVPASACPEATEAWAQADFPEGTPEAAVRGPDEWVDGCPSLDRVQEMIAAIRKDVELRAEMEASGDWPSGE